MKLDRLGLEAVGAVIEPVPVAMCIANLALIPQITPPPLGRVMVETLFCNPFEFELPSFCIGLFTGGLFISAPEKDQLKKKFLLNDLMAWIVVEL